MKGFTRRRAMVAVGVASAVALLGLAGCGRLDRSTAPAADNASTTTDLGWEAQALQAIGLETADLAPASAATAAADPAPAIAPAASPSASAKAGTGGAGSKRRHRLLRFAFGKSALHGEAVVKTDDGTKTVVVQRGTVTAIDATSVTVKSTDGFTLTWTFGTPITVIERRSQVQPSAIAVGTQVGLAGDKAGNSPSARLIVIPNKKS
jgi:hypothetical protein